MQKPHVGALAFSSVAYRTHTSSKRDHPSDRRRSSDNYKMLAPDPQPSSGKALSGINHRLSKLGSSICQRRIGKRVSAGLFDETFPGERLQRRRKTLAVGFQAGMHGQALCANCATLLAKPFKYLQAPRVRPVRDPPSGS
jgi:hypothetical protein